MWTMKPEPWRVDSGSVRDAALWPIKLLVPFWEGGGNSVREVGSYYYHGTNVGDVPWVRTDYGWAMDFPFANVHDRVTLRNPQKLFPGGTTPFSIIAVLEPDSAGGGNRGRILDAGSRGAVGPFTFETNNTDATNGLVLDVCRTSDSARVSLISPTANLVTYDGSLQIVGCTWVGDTARFYCNGKYGGYDDGPGFTDLKASTGTAVIGRRTDEYYGLDGRLGLLMYIDHFVPTVNMLHYTSSLENIFNALRPRAPQGFSTGGVGPYVPPGGYVIELEPAP